MGQKSPTANAIQQYANTIRKTTPFIRNFEAQQNAIFPDPLLIFIFRPALQFFSGMAFVLPNLIPGLIDKALYNRIPSVANVTACLCMEQRFQHLCTGFLIYNSRFFVFPKAIYDKYKLNDHNNWKQCSVEYERFIKLPNYTIGLENCKGEEPRVINEHLVYCKVRSIPKYFAVNLNIAIFPFEPERSKHSKQFRISTSKMEYNVPIDPIVEKEREEFVWSIGYACSLDYSNQEMKQFYVDNYQVTTKCLSPGKVIGKHNKSKLFTTDCFLRNIGSPITYDINTLNN